MASELRSLPSTPTTTGRWSGTEGMASDRNTVTGQCARLTTCRTVEPVRSDSSAPAPVDPTTTISACALEPASAGPAGPGWVLHDTVMSGKALFTRRSARSRIFLGELVLEEESGFAVVVSRTRQDVSQSQWHRLPPSDRAHTAARIALSDRRHRRRWADAARERSHASTSGHRHGRRCGNGVGRGIGHLAATRRGPTPVHGA